jgi:DNA-binding CsgD family transcriptional regulator
VRPRTTKLSRKETLVLLELARGSSTEAAALSLQVSPHTVRTHIKSILRKLDAKTRAHAVAIGLTEHAIEL